MLTLITVALLIAASCAAAAGLIASAQNQVEDARAMAGLDQSEAGS